MKSGHLLVQAEVWLEEELELCQLRVDNLSLIKLYDSDSRSSTLVSIFLFSGKLRKTHNYAEFNEAILASGEETAMILQSKCQGWYHHSRDKLSPVLDA